MKINLITSKESKEYDMKSGSTVADLFIAAGEISEAFIVARDGELVIEEEPLQENDTIEFIKITSGG